MRKTATLLCAFLSYSPLLCGQIPTEGLVAYWPFNGNAQDEGPHHLRTIPHNVAWAEDRFGHPNSALLLDADQAYLEVPDDPALHLYSFTYSFWIWVDQPVKEDVFYISKRMEKPDGKFSITIYSRYSSLNTFVSSPVAGETYLRSSLWLPKVRTWHNITVVGEYSNVDYIIYLDGIPSGRVDLNVVQGYDSLPLTIGVMKYKEIKEGFMKGRIDDIRIYKSGLSAAEVQALAADRREAKALGTDWMKRELPDGRYVALYTEKNKEISGTPFPFELKRRRPLWQNGWFIAGSLVLTCLLTLFIFQSQQRRKALLRKLSLDKFKAVEQERSRIARDLHDDLGSGLSAIGLLTEVARQKSNSHDLDAEILQMANTSAELSYKIREIIWLVSARFDNLENLISYLNHYAVDLFADTPTLMEVHLPLHIPVVRLESEQRRAFFNAAKAALHLMQQRAVPYLKMEFSESQSCLLTLRFPGPDVFLQREMEPRAAFNQAIQKLEEVGGSVCADNREQASLQFMLPLPIV